MTEKLERLIEKFIENGNPAIKPRLMRLLFASNFLTFLTLITISLSGIFLCWFIIGYQNEKLSESTADYTENFLENEMTAQLSRVVTSKSLQINEFLTIISHEAEITAAKMKSPSTTDFSIEKISDKIIEQVQSTENIFFVIDKNGKIILTSLNEGFFKVGTIFEKIKAGKNEVESIEIDGKEYYIAFAPIEISGWSYAELVDKEKIIAPAKVFKSEVEKQTADLNAHLNPFFQRLILAILILSILALFLFRWFSRKQTTNFVAPILELSDGVREIASGNFDKKLEISTKDEIEHLATCFNAMTDELKNYMANLKQVTANKERISTELQIAEDIQLSMLPRNFDFGRTDFEIFATMHAAKEVGGDFYDFYLLDENNLVITIADVSGKGVPAALFMAVSKTILKNFSMTMKNSEDLAAAVTCTNQQLCKNNDEMLFVTIFTGILNLQTGKLTYVNAAHESLIFYSARNEKFEFIKSAKRNYSLGLMEDIEYEQETLQLEPGDIIFQYTDGVTEAMNENRKLFGDERLLTALNDLHAKKISVKEILGGLRKSVAAFVKTAPQSDDITMLAVRYK